MAIWPRNRSVIAFLAFLGALLVRVIVRIDESGKVFYVLKAFEFSVRRRCWKIAQRSADFFLRRVIRGH